MLRAVCRSAHAAMWALSKSGVRFARSPARTARRSAGGSPGSRPGRCRAVIRLSRDPTRRTWRRGDGRRGSGGGRVSAPVMRLSMPVPDRMRGRKQRRRQQYRASVSRGVVRRAPSAATNHFRCRSLSVSMRLGAAAFCIRATRPPRRSPPPLGSRAWCRSGCRSGPRRGSGRSLCRSIAETQAAACA
jgi:hypothetical protein